MFEIFDGYPFVKIYGNIISKKDIILSNAELLEMVVMDVSPQMTLFHVEQFSWGYGDNKYRYIIL